MLWGNAPSSDEICWGKRYGNKNVKMMFYMIWGEKMPLVVMKNIGGKITTTNLPPRPPSTLGLELLEPMNLSFLWGLASKAQKLLLISTYKETWPRQGSPR